MFLFTKAKVSPQGTVNTADLSSIARSTAIFFAAPALMYLAQLTGTLNQNHFISLSEFIPSWTTLGTIEGWAIGILINLFLKFQNGAN